MSTPATPYTNDARPNVVWFMVDQMRGQAMSIAGDPNVCTPNLDRMCRDGAWFANAVMGFPLCCPARGAMVTGLYPHRCVPGHEYPLDPALPTIADSFNAAGYSTAWFGKWHLDGFREGAGRAAWHIVPRERRGRFSTWIGYDNNNSQYDCWVHGHDSGRDVPLHRLTGHETGALTDMLLDHIRQQGDRPFFACVSVQPPHNPYIAPAGATAERHIPARLRLRPNVPPIAHVEDHARRDLSGYYAQIEDIDRNVGRVLECLAELGIDDRTYVVFVSDHGDQHGCHGHFEKMTPYEEAIRVPWMIWGGKRWQSHPWQRTNHMPNHVDLSPTTLGLAGIPVPAAMQGYDYSWLMRGSCWAPRARLDNAPQEAYLQCVVPTQHAPSVDIPWRGIVTRDGWKYVAMEGQPYLLFNLNEDPYEMANLAHHAHARARRRELNERLRVWIEKTGDEFRLPEFAENGSPATAQAAGTRWPQPPST
ncbi:sulfatase [bacterium]|nr:sulfatase [bacterium]